MSRRPPIKTVKPLSTRITEEADDILNDAIERRSARMAMRVTSGSIISELIVKYTHLLFAEEPQSLPRPVTDAPAKARTGIAHAGSHAGPKTRSA